MNRELINSLLSVAINAFEKHELSQNDLEIVLDYLYKELDSRVNGKVVNV